jgi:hypothetical protein
MFLLFNPLALNTHALLVVATQIRQSRIPRDLPPLSPELREVLVGCILGDCHAQRRSANGHTRLQFFYGESNSAYVQHVHSLFSAYRTTRHITGSALVLSPLLFSMSLILYSTIKRVRRLCLLILGILLPLVGSRAMDDGSHGSGSTFVLTPLLRRRFNYLFGPKVQL